MMMILNILPAKNQHVNIVIVQNVDFVPFSCAQ